MDRQRLKEIARRSAKNIIILFPAVVGIVMIIALLDVLIPKSAYSSFFTGNVILDSLIGDIAGSVLAGNPITSYIIGGELLKQGVSLAAVTAFIVAWVTVGSVQLPIEMNMLGRRFAIARNLLSFLLSLIVAVLTVLMMGLI